LLHVQHDGDLICRNCGLVLEGRLMCDGPETRFFAEDGGPDPSRVGMPVDHLLPNASMGTVIGGKGRQAARIRLLNLSQRVPSKERCLLRTFKVMTRLGLHTLGLPEAAVALSKQMFSDMRERGIKRGRNLPRHTRLLHLLCGQGLWHAQAKSHGVRSV
jgi:transcription initiation factor TFIIIB Brf1 subunit/transcription initiation factor TFIIB